MNKQEFVKTVSKATGLSQEVTKTVLGGIEDVILDIIADEDSVRLGFGTIGGKTSAPRKARNPKTGEVIDVPAKRGRPYIKFSRSAKESE